MAIAAGAVHSLALKDDGTAVAWGDNSLGQIEVPADLNDVVAVVGGDNFSLAIRANQTIAAIQLSTQSPVIRFHTLAGRQYSVQYSMDLRSGHWSALLNGNVPGNGREVQVTDASTVSNSAAKFYRVIELR
jgi:hypothetical protein